MAVEAALAGLQAEVNCPICLDDLKDPVTIECGHNFCRFCLQQSWADLRGRLPCPVCHRLCQRRHLGSNTQLERMIDITKRLQITRSKKCQEERHLCEKHNQALTLFCEEDLEVLCPLCTQPPDHQGHQVRPMEEAAAHHRQRLSSYIEPLKKQVVDTQKLLTTLERKLLELREQAQNRRWKLATDLEHLLQSVDYEQEAVLSRLADQEKDIQRKFSANTNAFTDHISKVNSLLKVVAEKSVMSDVKLLTDIKSVLHSCESLKPPAMYCVQFRSEGCSLPPQYSVLQQIIQKFREEVTLDPETAHPNLLVSEDKKSVTFVRKRQRVPRNPGRFMIDPVVLGSEGFDCGRHYWEVQVDDKPEWAVGICKGSLTRERKQFPAEENSCWTIQLQNGDYVAPGPVPVTLVLKENPRGIGIFLDYELGQVSFYSLNDRSHIHSFMDKFSEVLKPYFCIGCDPKPLRVCSVRDYEGDL
ncbi:tripartite motif-containing protein 75-like [Glossophaga mutica]